MTDATPPTTITCSTSTAIALPNIRNDDTVELDLSAKVSTMSLSDADSLTLTPDLWASIYGYARYEDCLRAFTVCKSFLNDVIPRIKEIAVFDPRALKVGPARRFTGVKSVVIACLFADPPDAPPVPERPEGIGFDVTFHNELWIMRGMDDDEILRPLVVDPLVVSASVPFLSTLPSLRNVDILRYAVHIDHISDYDAAIRNDKPLRTFGIRYFDGYDMVWSKENDLNMRTLMMSFGGGYASGLLSTSVIVSPCCLFGYSSTGDLDWSCFSTYCAAWNAYDEPGQKHECMCHYISRNFPVKMVALNFCRGRSGCLPFEECFEIVHKRQGGREVLLSSDYILFQLERSLGGDMVDMAACYSQFGLRPCVTTSDIDRYYPERPDPTSYRQYRSQQQIQGPWETDDDVSDVSDNDQSNF